MYTNPLFADTSTSSTAHSSDEVIGEAENFMAKGRENPIDQDALKNTSNTIFNIFLGIGTVAAVAVGGVLGVKFMLSSVDEKADAKKLLVPYVIGCIVVFGAFGIWKLVITVMTGL